MGDSFVGLHFGDWHCGMRSGLVRPGHIIEIETDEYETESEEVELTDWSKWVWYEGFIPLLEKTADYAAGDPVVSFHTGDAIQGSWADGYLYVDDYTAQSDMALAAYDVMPKWIPNIVAHVLNYATPRHDYGQQQGTRRLARKLKERGYQVDCDAWLFQPFAGGHVDCTHHGPGIQNATIDWESAARRHAIKLTREMAERGEKPPMAILRGHTHVQVTAQVNTPWGGGWLETLMSICPPLCGPNEYAIRYVSTRSLPYIKIGGTMFRAEGGRIVDYYPFYVQKDCRIVPVSRAYNNGRYSQGDGEFG